MQFFTIIHRVRSVFRYGRRFGRFVPAQFRLPALVLGCLVVAAVIWWKTSTLWMALGFLGIVLFVALLFALINRHVLSNRTMDGLKDKDELTDTARSWNKAVEEYKTSVREDPSFYMLIGEPQSGKTTTLEKSGLSFPIGMKAISGSSGTRGCDWWFTDEAIFLDTAGRLTFHDTSAEATDEEEWNWFLDRLRRFRPRCPINGVVVTIPCTSQIGAEGEQYPAPVSIIDESEEARTFKAGLIRQALVDIQRRLQVSFPVYVLVTKADTIGGFVEFCGNLKARGQLQLFGWSRPKAIVETPFCGEEVVGAFQEIEDRLQQWRLHFLSNGVDHDVPDERDRMFAFPEELMKLRAALQQYLEKIFPPSRLVDPLFLRGFYISSGEQKGNPVSTIVRDVLGTDDLADDPRVDETRAHFVADFYRKKVLREPGLIEPTCGRKRLGRRLRAWGYGTAAVAALVGVTMIGTWFYRIWNDVKQPEELVIELSEHLTGPESTLSDDAVVLATPEQRYKSLSGTLTALQGLDKEIDLIDSRQRLGTFGPFRGLSDGLREDLVALLRRAARVGFVHGVLEPLAQEISGLLAGLDPDAINGPADFEAYRGSITTFIGMLCADIEQSHWSRADGDTMESRDGPVARSRHLAALLEFCHERTTDNATDKRYRRLEHLDHTQRQNIADQYDAVCTYMFGSGTPNAGGWQGTGDYVAWLGDGNERAFSSLKNELKDMLTRANDRWRRAFAPDETSWWRAPNEAHTDSTYYWWRVFSLFESLRHTQTELEKLEVKIGGSSDTLNLSGWDESARQWCSLHDQLRDATRQLDELAGVDVELTWQDAEEALYKAWHDDFYETLITMTSRTQVVRSKELDRVIDQARRELESAWQGSVSRYKTLYDTLGPKDLLNLDDSEPGVNITDSFEAMTSRHERIRRLIEESLSPWSDPGGADQWVAKGILGNDGALGLEPWPSSGATRELLEAQRERLDSVAKPQNLPPSDQENPALSAVCKVAVRAIVTRVLTQFADTHPDSPKPPRGPVDLSQPAPPVAFGRGQPERLLVDYLQPVAQWVDNLSREYPPLERENETSARTDALETLDRYGSDYLYEWSELWATDYVRALDGKVVSCLGTTSWSDFVAAVTGAFKQGATDMTEWSRRLSDYADTALAAMELPAPPDESATSSVLPETRTRWASHYQRYAVASAFHQKHAGDATFLTPHVTALLERIRDLGGLPTETLVQQLLQAEYTDLEGQETRLALTYFTHTLEQLAAADRAVSESDLGFVLVAYQLSDLEKRARTLLTDVVTSHMELDYKAVHEQVRPLGFPFSDGPEPEWQVVEGFFGKESAFSQFAALYRSQLDSSEAPPNDGCRNGLFIRVDVPRHVRNFVSQCGELRHFLGLGPDAPPAKLVGRVRRAPSDRSLDARISYLKLGLQSGDLYLPHPKAEHWYELTWHMGKDEAISVSATEDARGTAIARDVFCFKPSGTAPTGQIRYTDQLFALLRFLQDFPSSVKRGADQKGVTVTVRLPASFHDNVGDLAVEFDFPGRLFPESLPKAQPWH